MRLLASLGLLGWAAGAAAYAHGYHGAALAARNLQQWEERVARSLGLERVSDKRGTVSGEMSAGGDLRSLSDATRTRYRRIGRVEGHVGRSQVGELVNVLAWMGRQNIIPSEFPSFDLERIPDYREAAKNMLAAVGSDAAARLIQDLVTPPPETLGLKLAPGFRQDVIDVLGRMGRIEPLKGTTARDVEKAIRTIVESGIPKAKQLLTVQTLLSALRTPELKKLKASKAIVKRARRQELLQRCLNGEEQALGERELLRALEDLILERPAHFIEFRQRFPRTAAQCAEALAKTPSAKLRKLYEKSGDSAALDLLLEKPDALRDMGPQDLENQKIREAMIAAAERGAAPPGVAAMLLESRKPTVDELRSLVSSGKTWEKLGAFHLLLRKLPQTEESATWLLTHFQRLPSSVQAATKGRVGQRVGQASTESLIGALGLDQASLHQKIAAALLERTRSAGGRDELRRQQDALLRAFAEDRSGNRQLIPLMATLRTKAALASLVDALTDADANVWQTCRNELCKIHSGGLSYGPRNSADEASRAAAQKEWRKWLAGYKEPP